MPRDKGQPALPRADRDYQRELEYLYARRCAIEALIVSLQTYDRCRDCALEAELKEA